MPPVGPVEPVPTLGLANWRHKGAASAFTPNPQGSSRSADLKLPRTRGGSPTIVLVMF